MTPSPRLCPTLPVASSSCPVILRAALTFPVTSLPCLVPHLRLYSLLPPTSPSSSCSLLLSVHIPFLLLHLPGYRGGKHWEHSVLISIFSTAIVSRVRRKSCRERTASFLQHQDKACSVQERSLENLAAKVYKSFPAGETGIFPTLFWIFTGATKTMAFQLCKISIMALHFICKWYFVYSSMHYRRIII